MSQENILPYPNNFFSEDEDFTSKESFDTKLVYNYPSAEKKVQINIHRIDMKKSTKNSFAKVFTTFISPHGLAFKGSAELKTGTLLKIDVKIPDFWSRKQRFVEYKRINTPNFFRLLAKVVHNNPIGIRSRKRLILAKTVNIDPIDQKVLSEYINGAKK